MHKTLHEMLVLLDLFAPLWPFTIPRVADKGVTMGSKYRKMDCPPYPTDKSLQHSSDPLA